MSLSINPTGWISPVFTSADSKGSSGGSKEREDLNESPPLVPRSRGGSIEITPLSVDKETLDTPLLSPTIEEDLKRAPVRKERTDSDSKELRSPRFKASKWFYAIPILATISAAAQSVLTTTAVFSGDEETWQLVRMTEGTTAVLIASSFVATGYRVITAYNLYGRPAVFPVIKESFLKPFFPEGVIATTLLSIWPLVIDA